MTKELLELQARAAELEQRLNDIDNQYNRGMIDIGRWTSIKTSLGTDRRVLLSELQQKLEGTEGEELNPIIEKVKANASENEVKTELKGVAQNKGWGQTVLDKIDQHKGELVSLVTNLAIEVSKRLVSS